MASSGDTCWIRAPRAVGSSANALLCQTPPMRLEYWVWSVDVPEMAASKIWSIRRSIHIFDAHRAKLTPAERQACDTSDYFRRLVLGKMLTGSDVDNSETYQPVYYGDVTALEQLSPRTCAVPGWQTPAVAIPQPLLDPRGLVL